MIMPVYIAEMTPKESRGALSSTIGLTLNAGVNIALFANIGYAKFTLGWRVSIIIIALVGLVFSIGMKFLPHTPRYVNNNKQQQTT